MMTLEIKFKTNEKNVVYSGTHNTFGEVMGIAIDKCGHDGYIKFIQEDKGSRDLRARTSKYIIDIMY